MNPISLKEIRKIPKKGVVVSLFCGFGANTIGYNMAGLNVSLAIDFNKEVKKVYEFNHRSTSFLLDDIKNIRGESIVSRIGDGIEIDILDASPPLHSLLQTGRVSFDTDNTHLFGETARLIKEMKPKVFMIANDKRLAVGKSRLNFNEIIETLKEAGYKVDFEIMNSKYYGVAQDKEILIVMGVREDLKVKPVFPEVLEKVYSTREAIEDMIEENIENEKSLKRPDYMRAFMEPICEGFEEDEVIDDFFSYNRPEDYKADKWEKPYYALERSFKRPLHPVFDRMLSVNEALRLQGFPDDFIISSHPLLNWQKICSAIPPNLIKHIALTINREILERLT